MRLWADRGRRPRFLVDESDTRLTYSQVDDIAGRQASAFRDLGVGKDDSVAVFMDSSATLGATAFGINRAGGVWSPVDRVPRRVAARAAARGEVQGPGRGQRCCCRDLGSQGSTVRARRGQRRPRRRRPARSHDARTRVVHQLRALPRHDRPAPRRHQLDPLDVRHHRSVKGVMQSHAVWMLWAQRHNEVYRRRRARRTKFYYPMPMYNSGGWSMCVPPRY
ncbi:AMP-binding protein [Streptomyces sp. KL116D]|uniref:AMP-binding protein n=1 Tax=Streptomyces sp. KL116D TaxID=3045152 RepID=UPI003558AF0C